MLYRPRLIEEAAETGGCSVSQIADLDGGFTPLPGRFGARWVAPRRPALGRVGSGPGRPPPAARLATARCCFLAGFLQWGGVVLGVAEVGVGAADEQSPDAGDAALACRS